MATFAEDSDWTIDGLHYFLKVAAADPMLVVPWMLPWLSWQVDALILLFRKA